MTTHLATHGAPRFENNEKCHWSSPGPPSPRLGLPLVPQGGSSKHSLKTWNQTKEGVAACNPSLPSVPPSPQCDLSSPIRAAWRARGLSWEQTTGTHIHLEPRGTPRTGREALPTPHPPASYLGAPGDLALASYLPHLQFWRHLRPWERGTGAGTHGCLLVLLLRSFQLHFSNVSRIRGSCQPCTCTCGPDVGGPPGLQGGQGVVGTRLW